MRKQEHTTTKTAGQGPSKKNINCLSLVTWFRDLCMIPCVALPGDPRQTIPRLSKTGDFKYSFFSSFIIL